MQALNMSLTRPSQLWKLSWPSGGWYAIKSNSMPWGVVRVVQDTVCRCLMDIAAGMDYLHTLGVLHGAPSMAHTGLTL